MHIHLTTKSRNVKTGAIPVSTTSASTCAIDCPYNGNGCYAQAGPLKLHWDKVTSGARGGNLASFAMQIAALPDNQIWRHNQAGDLPGDGVKIDRKSLATIVSANKGKRGFTYTHYNIANAHNRGAIKAANRNGFTINLSANNLNHADKLVDLNIGPVVAVLPHDFTGSTMTPQGRKVVQCPATYRDDVTCASCQLCQRKRKTIVGFPAHGVSKRKASAIANG